MTQFDTVELRHYPVILSDNPGGKYGPSIELGWEYSRQPNDDSKMRLSAYEKERQRRSRLYLSHARRETMLREASYSEADIKRATRRKNCVRRERASSNLFMSPVTKIKSMVSEGRRTKKLKAAKRNLEKMEGSDFFYKHEEVYQGWWKPHLEVTLFK